MLQEAKIHAKMQASRYPNIRPVITLRGIEQFAIAFPHLRSFSLSGVTIPQAVFRDFFLYGLPRLEQLKHLYCMALGGENRTNLDIFSAVLGVDTRTVFWLKVNKIVLSGQQVHFFNT